MAEYTIPVDSNVVVRNYKPIESRTQQDTDREYNSANGELSLPSNYEAAFEALKSLDGKPTLSWNDAVKARQLIGTAGIKSIGIDHSAQVVSLTLEDNSYVNITIDNHTYSPKENMQNDIAAKKAEYVKFGFLSFIDQFLFGGGKIQGDEIAVTYPKGTTLGDIKARYNLPDGALSSYSRASGATGNRDECEAPEFGVTFSVKVFAENNGLTVEQVKALFKDSQQ